MCNVIHKHTDQLKVIPNPGAAAIALRTHTSKRHNLLISIGNIQLSTINRKLYYYDYV